MKSHENELIKNIQERMENIDCEESLMQSPRAIIETVQSIRNKNLIKKFLLGRGSYGEIIQLNKKYVIKTVKVVENQKTYDLLVKSTVKEYAIMHALKSMNNGDYHVVKPIGELIYSQTNKLCGILLEKYHGSLQVDMYTKNEAYYNPNAVLFQLLSKPTVGLSILQSIFQQISMGVYHLHQHNIVHFDLKLENILIKRVENIEHDDRINFYVAIADFGLSQVKNCDRPNDPIIEDKNYHELATPHYRAPELYMEFGNYGFEVDIWSLGIVGLRLMEIFIYSRTFDTNDNKDDNNKDDNNSSSSSSSSNERKYKHRCLFPLLMIDSVCSSKNKQLSFYRESSDSINYTIVKKESIRQYYDMFYQIGIYDTNLYSYHLEQRNENNKKKKNEKKNELFGKFKDTIGNTFMDNEQETSEWWNAHFQSLHNRRKTEDKFKFYESNWEHTTLYKITNGNVNVTNKTGIFSFTALQQINNKYVDKNCSTYENIKPLYSFTYHIKPLIYHLCGEKGKKLFCLVAALLEFDRDHRPTIEQFSRMFTILFEENTDNKRRKLGHTCY